MICPPGWSKEHVVIKYIVVVIPLAEFDICFLELEDANLSHNRKIYNSRIGEVILMGSFLIKINK